MQHTTIPQIEKRKWHAFIMIACFVYGGVSLVIFALQTLPLLQDQANDRLFENFEGLRNSTTNTTDRTFVQPILPTRNTNRFQNNPSRRMSLYYPAIITSFLGSIISIFAGLALLDLIKKKDRETLTREVIDAMITPDEKRVIAYLEQNDGETTQTQITTQTNLSKVKIHRIVKRLEQLNIVKKLPYGITNKIRLLEKK